jgi:ribosomal protein S18 acetylase RimI-like enzyme
MQLIIKRPETTDEFEQYYFLRWQILRRPWAQVQGSEKDAHEDSSFHFIALAPGTNAINNQSETVVGVSRLQFNTVQATENTAGTYAQIRYMAVSPSFRNKGVASALIAEMEKQVQISSVYRIMLDARESATGFYEKLGYQITGKSYLLFDEIQHFTMEKNLS